MDSNKRQLNEAEFEHWEDLEDGGRKYWFDVKGKVKGFARYTKLVNREEVTVSFVQEIYDQEGKLIQIHEKYPVDKGHIKVEP